MTSAVFIPLAPMFAGLTVVPSSRGPMVPSHGGAIGRGRLPTDSVGSCALTLNNVVVGSRYRVEVLSTGVVAADGIATTDTVDLSVPYYAAGNPANTLLIKVRKASESPFYRAFETVSAVGADPVSSYVFQQLDE